MAIGRLDIPAVPGWYRYKVSVVPAELKVVDDTVPQRTLTLSADDVAQIEPLEVRRATGCRQLRLLV